MAVAPPRTIRLRFRTLVGGGILAFLVVSSIAVPKLLRYRIKDSERSPVQDVRAIDRAVHSYVHDHHGVPSDLSRLREYLPRDFPCSTELCEVRGYRFSYRVLTAEASSVRYEIRARPRSLAGIRSYYLDQTGVLRNTQADRWANETDPVLQ